MIRHAALLRLRHLKGSAEEAGFLKGIATLADIPGVRDFVLWSETSPKNPFTIAVSMVFADQAAHDA